jgi:hypothetical protein
MTGKHSFSARLLRVAMFPGVAVPRAISRSFGARGSIPVLLRVNGLEPFRTTLLPDGKGGHFVYVNGKVRKAAAAMLGDRISVELAPDSEPRGAALPPDLAEVLGEEGVLQAWWSFAPGMREQLLRWLDAAVHESTRARRLGVLVERAHARREKLVDDGM